MDKPTDAKMAGAEAMREAAAKVADDVAEGARVLHTAASADRDMEGVNIHGEARRVAKQIAAAIRALPLPTEGQSGEGVEKVGSHNQPIPAAMKPWAGGDSAPEDWDGGDVLWQTPDGREMSGTTAEDQQWRVVRTHPYNIIAYTPKPTAAPLPSEAPEGWREVSGRYEIALRRIATLLDHSRDDDAENCAYMVREAREALSASPCPKAPSRESGEVERLRKALREVALETHETIPPDGKAAAFGALDRIARIVTAALQQPEAPKGEGDYAR